MRMKPLHAACVIGIATGWPVTNTGAAAETLSDAYGVGLARIGLLTTALFTVHLAMQLPAGRLSDRFGPARVTGIGLLVMLVFNLLALAAPDPNLALVARAAMGVGLALGFLGGVDYVRATGGSPLAQGVFGGVATAGAGVALPVVAALVPSLGWCAPYLSAIVVTVAALVALWAARGAPITAPVRRGTVPLRTLTGDSVIRGLAVLFAGSFGVSIIVGNWAPTLLEDTTTAGPLAAGLIVGVSMTLPALSRPFSGWVLGERPGWMKPLIVAGAVGGAAGTLLLASGSVVGAIVGTCLVGVAAGMTYAPGFSGAAHRHPSAPAAAVGLVNGAGAFTIIVGVLLAGVAFEQDAGRWAFVVLAALWAVSAVAVPVLGRRAENVRHAGGSA